MENQGTTLGPQLPLDKLVFVFIASMSKPLTFCTKLFLGSLVAMGHPDKGIDVICRRAPQVLEALMLILTRHEGPERTLEDLLRGWHDHAHCPCEHDSDPLVLQLREFAENLIGSNTSFLPFLILSSMASPLNQALICVEKELSYKTLRSYWTKHDSECWPRSPADIFPHGTDRTVESLLSWPLRLTIAARYAGHSPIDMATMTTRPLMLLALIEQTSPLLSGIIGHRIFPRTIVTTLHLLLAQNTRIVPHMPARAKKALDTCAYFLRNMRLFTCARDIDLQAFVSGAAKSHLLEVFLTAISDLLGAVSKWTRVLGFAGDLEAADSPCKWILEGFALAAAAVFRQLGRWPDSTQYHSIIVRVCHDISRANGDPFYLVISPLGRLYQEDLCCRRGCHTSGATTWRPLALCSGCRVARYCSKLCQRAAWRDEKSRHKGACDDLAAFKQLVYPTQLFPLKFGAWRSWLKFEEHQATQAQEELAWRVFDHLAYALDDALIHTTIHAESQSSSMPDDANTQQNSSIQDD